MLIFQKCSENSFFCNEIYASGIEAFFRIFIFNGSQYFKHLITKLFHKIGFVNLADM
ncbi:hypothetical protein VO54_01423 [Elizabethkingia miricola]|nr:hypothetical protein VO54_01423 [Elizabethkingia miricola]